MTILPAGVRPANPTRVPRMSISVAEAIDNARLHLRTGNPGAYARSLAGEHRAQNVRQQRAIEAVIAAMLVLIGLVRWHRGVREHRQMTISVK